MTGPGATTTRRLHVGGWPVRVLEQGTGPPVVLIHGLGLSGDLWADHLDRLARSGYRAIAPDLPGFGKSAGPAAGLTVPAAATWLAALADMLDLDGAAWVGHSIAAQQLVRLAAEEPERVGALVLAAPTGRSGRHYARDLIGLMVTAFREPVPLVGRIVRRYLRTPLPALGTWIRAEDHDTALDAPRVKCPTLLVSGEDDPVVPAQFVALLERLLPDARTVRIPGAAHAVALDPVHPFMDAVLRFLAHRYAFRRPTIPHGSRENAR